MADRKIKARFIEPMLLRRTETLPEGGSWTYELKLDGFRAEAIKSGGRVHLRSRNDNYLAQPKRQHGMDWLFLMMTLLVVSAAVALPIWLLSLLIRHL